MVGIAPPHQKISPIGFTLNLGGPMGKAGNHRFRSEQNLFPPIELE